MTGSFPDYWVVQRQGEEWVASAMALVDGRMVQHTPRVLGAGRTPQAALLRAITPARERHPSRREAAETFNVLRQRLRYSYAEAAAHLPIAGEALRQAVRAHSEAPSRWYDWALLLGATPVAWRAALREVQREADQVADPV